MREKQERTATKRANHHDIARLANVTQATVSRALDPEKSHLVSDKTKTRIFEVARRLSFQVDLNARRMRTGHTRSLSFLIMSSRTYDPSLPDFHTHHENLNWELINGVIDGARRHNYEIQLVPVNPGDDREYILQHIGYPNSDGAIFFGVRNLESICDSLAGRNIPGIIIRLLPGASGRLPEYAIDPEPGFRDAVANLRAMGMKRVGCLLFAEPSEKDFVADRYRLLQSLLEQAGLFDPSLTMIGRNEIELRRLLTPELLQRFDAIFCQNDAMAHRCRTEFEMMGLPPERRPFLVGFDNNPAYRGFSTIAVPRFTIGQNCAEALIDSIENGTEIANRIFPLDYIR